MKIISGKSIFASLIFLLVMSFIVNNFLNDDNFLRDKDKQNSTSTNQDKIIGIAAPKVPASIKLNNIAKAIIKPKR